MTISFRPLRFFLLAKCLFAISSGTLQAVRFSKTDGVTVSTACRLSVFTPYGNQISVKKACTIQCMKTTNCRFFCIGVAGIDCDLYNSYVAIRFPGHASGKAYKTCHSSWGDPRDVIKTNTPMTYSTYHDLNTYKPAYATDGYAECGVCTYFITDAYGDSHVQFDLGSVMRVKSVIVHTTYVNNFDNIVIYLGNTTTFKNHTVYATQTGPAVAFDSSVFSGNKEIGGRYLTFFSTKTENVGICEIQITRI